MEIERKWMVNGWPEDLPLYCEQMMRQGYISVRPTVRIREEVLLREGKPEQTEHILCFKSGGGIARQEIEFPIAENHFRQLEELIGLPLIPKLRRTYELPDGLHLEVSLVDEGMPTEFWYAEIEYETVQEAEEWDPAVAGLEDYLSDEVTGQPGQSMGAYWEKTRAVQIREDTDD